MRLPAAVALVCLLASGTASAREHHEHHVDGRHHLEKANALADDGKCAAAVKEFTAAYDKLHDPIVLFNRAECYRRLGQNADAVADYRGFLAGFPAAPNRAEIEARIATLEKPAAPPPARTTRAPATPSVARAPAPPSPVAPAPVAATPPAPMPFLPPPPTEGGDAKTLVEAPRPPTDDTSHAESHGSHWWIWATLAVVAVGGGVAGYLYFRPKDQAIPTTSLGNYRF
jgi:tetratricopeptide (TPR) repeat protein